jgi:UPF0755 protein
VAAAVLVLVLLPLAGAGWCWRELHRPHAGWPGDRVDVVLEPGLGAGAMLDRLAARGVVARPGLLRAWLRVKGGSGDLRAGEYRFDRPASPLEVLGRLRAGDVLLYPVTVPEGLVYREVAARLAEAGFGPVDALLQAFGDPTPILDLVPDATDLEGYLFPDTYHFPRGIPATEVAGTMVRHFRNVIDDEFRRAAEEVGLAIGDAVVLASLIEKETGLADERPLVSRVFHNRLRKGMRLQCDPTVRYALMRAGRPVERLTYKDLEFDSPWNTYVVRGLPPSPIANPGRASLIAAVRPAEGDLLYFVAAPGGGHRFSKDLAAHQRAVAEWRRYSRSAR